MNAKHFLELIRDNEQEMKEMLNFNYHRLNPETKDDFSTTVTYANGKYIAAGCAEGEVSEERMLELAEWYMYYLLHFAGEKLVSILSLRKEQHQ